MSSDVYIAGPRPSFSPVLWPGWKNALLSFPAAACWSPSLPSCPASSLHGFALSPGLSRAVNVSPSSHCMEAFDQIKCFFLACLPLLWGLSGLWEKGRGREGRKRGERRRREGEGSGIAIKTSLPSCISTRLSACTRTDSSCCCSSISSWFCLSNPFSSTGTGICPVTTIPQHT